MPKEVLLKSGKRRQLNGELLNWLLFPPYGTKDHRTLPPLGVESKGSRRTKKLTPCDIKHTNSLGYRPTNINSCIALLIKRAQAGNNFALQELVQAAASICEFVDLLTTTDFERVVPLAKSSTSWPVGISNLPRFEKNLGQLIKKLDVGRSTKEPYDVPRSRRKPSVAKTIAVKLITIIDALANHGDDLMLRSTILSEMKRSKHLKEVWGPSLPNAENAANQSLEVVLGHLREFGKFLESPNPLEELADIQSHATKCSRFDKGLMFGDANPLTDKAIELLYTFTAQHPEKCAALGILGRSKGPVYARTHHKDPEATRINAIQQGINFEVKQAMKAIKKPWRLQRLHGGL